MQRWLSLVLLIGLGCCSPGSTTTTDVAIQFEVLSTGKDINLEDHVKPGHFTVFDFYADWCPPCKELDKSLVGLKKTYGDRLVVYKLDIVNWDSELAQAKGIGSLPYLAVYNEKGELIASEPSNKSLPKLIHHLNL
ncbi:thioredoxin family protein [Acanthopleuribacter pedis]|uniref:Redoxin domain-containing protein n=1 Tax=Acanthopleuribacter pedis TaxID=442870 RepID=A0A8J7Q9S3_9BACT|nr:thioredoxin family protein [Acanthopleuribacter pedis]MBO1321316.1 redoxin domain-containing protein [Acanthopleuribacter pedis]